jgi:hypothetical protein
VSLLRQSVDQLGYGMRLTRSHNVDQQNRLASPSTTNVDNGFQSQLNKFGKSGDGHGDVVRDNLGA